MKLKFTFLAILFFTILGNSGIIAQYKVVLKNDTMITSNQYDFEIFIKSESGILNLTAYQFILTINDSITQTAGNLSFNYIVNSSELKNIPDYIDIIDDRGTKNFAIGSNPGSDSIFTSYVKIGSFRISGSNPFGNIKTNVNWDFEGLIKSEININDTNRIVPSNYINSLTNPLYTATGISTDSKTVYSFELFQNYPNPFNPATEIKYSLPEAADVKLLVYNVIGQQVASLINSNMQSGIHRVTFDGSDLPSGIYIYRLQTSYYTQTRKMILLK